MVVVRQTSYGIMPFDNESQLVPSHAGGGILRRPIPVGAADLLAGPDSLVSEGRLRLARIAQYGA